MNAQSAPASSDLKASPKETISRTGKMMLEGWRLLAQVCPICNSPLMSKQDKLHCPGCDMPVRYESEAESQQNPDEYYEDADEAIEPQSFEEMKKEYDLINRSRDAVSKKLGEKMLAGWTLLGASCTRSACSGTPLMHSIKDPLKLVCVCCDGEYVQTSFGTIEAAAPSQNPLVTAWHEPASAAPSSTTWSISDAPILDFSKEKSKTDSSSRLSEKLIKGWAMLNEVCSNAGCGSMPLMRDLAGVKHCVDCGFSSAGPSTTALGVTVPSPPASSARTVGPAGSLRSRRGGLNASDDNEDDDNEDDDNEDEEDAAMYSSYVAARLSGGSTAVTGGTGLAGNRLTSVETEALRVCRAKLSDAAGLLEASTDTKEAIQLAVLMAKLAEASRALRQLV